ncbi:MAG: ABC transporter substrate-binding protein [Albidovulum sp.]|nr:ABC transporter substrate-binding protein [Albidovulum sp.]
MKYARMLATVGLTSLAATAATAEITRLGADVDSATMDPRIQRNTTEYRVNNLVYDGLIKLNADLQVEPGLAESWENPEPTIWIFNLRENVTFHDGSTLVADDVVYTFETILDPDLKARFRSLFTPIETIEALDANTVRITLKEPYAPLLSYLDMGIVSKDYVESGGDIQSVPVGTGPLQLANWERGAKITLEPFEGYWGGAPDTEGIEFVVVGDNTARAQAFEAGDLDIIQSPLSSQDIGRLVENTQFQNEILGGLGITYLNFNTAHPLLSDPALRRALAMLVDQETIVNAIYEGVDQVATSILLPSSWAYDASITQPGFDPEGAKAAFAAAGWTDSNGDGTLDKDGQPLSIVLSTHSEDPNRIQSLEYIQAIMLENGVDASISIADWPAFSEGVRGGQHEIALLGWLNIVDPDRLMFGQFHTGGSFNWGSYSNSEVDAHLDTGRSATEIGDRTAAYQAAAAIIADELPYFVIAYQGYQVFHTNEVSLTPDARGMMRSVIGK